MRAVLSCGVVYYVVQGGTRRCDHSNQKPLSSALLIIAVMLFFVLYKVILTFESDDEILKCDHSNESY